MPVLITTVTNLQELELELEVSGPTPANRLFILTGTAQLADFATPPPEGQKQETFTLLVGPPLTRTQFVRAIASAGPTDVTTGGSHRALVFRSSTLTSTTTVAGPSFESKQSFRATWSCGRSPSRRRSSRRSNSAVASKYRSHRGSPEGGAPVVDGIGGLVVSSRQ